MLEVRVEAALRGDHGVASVVTETRLLPADGADLGHRPGSVANGRFGYASPVSIPLFLIVVAIAWALIVAFIFALELAGTAGIGFG